MATSSAASSVSKRWTVDIAVVITRMMNADSCARRSLLVVLLMPLAGCGGPAQSEAAPPAAAATPAGVVAPAPGPAPEDGEERRFTGVLHYTEIKPIKSVESYMGREFSLDTKGDGQLNIKASAAVSGEQLRALDGATITIRGRYHPEKSPPNDVQAPMGADGPMPWPAYYEVIEVVSGPARP